MKKQAFQAKLNQLFWISLLFYFSTQLFGFSAYSNDELDQLEKQFVTQINHSNQVIRLPLANLYFNHLGNLLAQQGHMDPPHFFIVNSNEINAFAGPGGHIGVNSQLILTSQNESELAAVLAHEMAHVRLHHLYRMIEHQKQMRIPMLASLLAAIALGAVDPALSSGALMASLTGFAQDTINFTRANEKEADRIGIDMLTKAGIDPRGMINFFKKMQLNSRYYYTANIPAILRTHPLDEDRIAEAENRCSTHLGHQTTDRLEFHLMQELIRNTVDQDTKRLNDYYHQRCHQHPQDIACRYGQDLAKINASQFQSAHDDLQSLSTAHPEILYFKLALADTELGQGEVQHALARLQMLYHDFPDHYAVIMAYGQALLQHQKNDRAVSVFLKGTRLFKTDLSLCEGLARAEAANHRSDYAYFMKAQCFLIQDQPREAMRLLKLAQTMVKKDPYLSARIQAKMEEIRSNMQSLQ